MAPEVVHNNGGHDMNVDWWSVGVLTIELLSGQSPFSRDGEDNNQSEISNRIQKCPPNIPEKIGSSARDLIIKLLQKQPSRRLGYNRDAEELKRHKFFKDIDWNALKNKRYKAPMIPHVKDKYDCSQFSDEFTNSPAIDEPAERPDAPNADRFFRGNNTEDSQENGIILKSLIAGYSFVAPHLRIDTMLNQEEPIADRPSQQERPILDDVLLVQKQVC